MRRGLVLGCVAAAVVLTAPPAAQAGSCRPVTAGAFKATGIKASNTSCASARAKLRVWFRRGGLPRDQFGWYCTSTGGSRRLCSGGNGGGAPHFTFRVRRVSASHAIGAALPPVFWTNCSDAEYRPRRITYVCGGASAGGRLRAMRWSSWSSTRARGRGLTKVRVFGIRGCAFFCYRSYRARVFLSEPRYCPSVDRQVFRRFEVRYRDNEAARKFAVRFRCDGRFFGTP